MGEEKMLGSTEMNIVCKMNTEVAHAVNNHYTPSLCKSEEWNE
jgi:hypothetical protein